MGKDPDDQWSVEIVGAMNPAIHHPAWYRLLNILTQDEADEALRAGGTDPHTSSTQSTLATSGFEISCDAEHWTISTTSPDGIGRIRDIAVATFRALPHTPVSAYAFNATFHRNTGVPHVGRALVAMSGKMALAVGEQVKPTYARLEFASFPSGHVFSVAIEPSFKGASQVFVGMSCYHTFGKSGQIDLDGPLRQAIERDFVFGQQCLDSIIKALIAHHESGADAP